MRFEAITAHNQAWVDRIYAGDSERFWVHYNSYWYHQSREHADITARLIYVDAVADPVGFIAHGQFYADLGLTEPVPGWIGRNYDGDPLLAFDRGAVAGYKAQQ